MKYDVRVTPKNGMFFKTFLVCSQLIFLNTFWEVGHYFSSMILLDLVEAVSSFCKVLEYMYVRTYTSKGCSEKCRISQHLLCPIHLLVVQDTAT